MYLMAFAPSCGRACKVSFQLIGPVLALRYVRGERPESKICSKILQQDVQQDAGVSAT